jgi:hypothetical protein
MSFSRARARCPHLCSRDGRMLQCGCILLAVLGSAAGPDLARAQGRVSTGVISQRFAPDARSAAMGQAATALAEGPTAAYWNPGALGWQRGRAWAGVMPLTYTQLVPDLADDVKMYSTAAAGAFHGLGMGFNLNYLDYGRSEAVSEDQTPLGSFDSSEYTFSLGLGANLGRWLFAQHPWLDWGVGISLKQMQVVLAPSGPFTTEPFGGAASDIELGTMAGVSKQVGEPGTNATSVIGLRFGAVLDNVLDHEITLVDAAPADPLGKTYRLAVAAVGEFGRSESVGSILQLRATWEVSDLTGKAAGVPEGSAGDGRVLGFGLEFGVANLIGLRMGHLDDDRGEIDDDTYGFAIGGDFLPNYGARLEFASNPQAEGLSRTKTWTISGWGRF